MDEKKYLIRCNSCGWFEKTNGTTPELSNLKEVISGCQKCGKSRSFRCPTPGCGGLAKLLKFKNK